MYNKIWETSISFFSLVRLVGPFLLTGLLLFLFYYSCCYLLLQAVQGGGGCLFVRI